MKKLALAGIISLAFGSSAFAADMAQRPVYKAAPAAQLFNWSGVYVGGYVGYMDGHTQDISGGGPKVKLDGGVYGGLIGVNWQTGNFVYGLEADGGWSDADHGADNNNFSSFKDRFVGNIRARAGIAVDRVLFFVAGGWSFTENKITHFGNSTKSEDFNTWTIGGGIDWAATQNLILRVEYLYADYNDTKTYPFFNNTDPHRVRYSDQNTVRGAAIWKF